MIVRTTEELERAAYVAREPSPLMIWAGAAFALGALYLLTVFLFSL